MHISKRDEEQELRSYEVRLKATRLLNADPEADNYILDVCGESYALMRQRMRPMLEPFGLIS
jgi:hypothetical protein